MTGCFFKQMVARGDFDVLLLGKDFFLTEFSGVD
jgi:hypothetical protein